MSVHVQSHHSCDVIEGSSNTVYVTLCCRKIDEQIEACPYFIMLLYLELSSLCFYGDAYLYNRDITEPNNRSNSKTNTLIIV